MSKLIAVSIGDIKGIGIEILIQMSVSSSIQHRRCHETWRCV